MTDRQAPRLLRGSASHVWLLAMCWLPVVGVAAFAEDRPHYNRDIRPILVENCFACHGPDSAARQADLRLDQRDAAVDAGAITPGEPDESELIFRIFAADAELVMPPPASKKQLSPAQRASLRDWIVAGAEYEPHWSLIVPTRPDLPADGDPSWVKNPIDSFVLSQLQQLGLSPAAESAPHALFRRLHLDITGLPPRPEDVAVFVSDYQQHPDVAVATWVDRLMELPAWGEHRARYWLDAARYADTHGMHFDNYREMWPYRDWVIRSFNANQPFDQFVVEQLAGDLLADPSQDQLVATGFQRCNMTTNEGGTIEEENLALYAADRVQTFGWVFLGLTTNCCQCHDHKYDPLSMRDFYALAAYFRNTTQPGLDGNVKDGRGPVITLPSAADLPRWKAIPEEIAAVSARRDARKEHAHDAFQQWLAGLTFASLNAQLPDEGLVVYIPLNEGSGGGTPPHVDPPHAADETRIIQATGKVTWMPDGKWGPAPVMKSGATYVVGDVGDYELDQSFSYGAWVMAASKSVSGGIIARMDQAQAHRGWDLWQNDSSFAVHMIDAWPDNAFKVTTSANSVKPGEWQHVFVTYDGCGQAAGVKIYIDGQDQTLTVEKNTLQVSASIRTTTPLRIGQREHGQVFEGGAVQGVRLYERKLSAAEVKRIANDAVLRSWLAESSGPHRSDETADHYDLYLEAYDPEYPALVEAVAELEAEQAAIRARSPITHIQQERPDTPATTYVLMRGEYDKPGDPVAAAPPVALHPLPTGAANNRLGLAQWVVDPANPLTARVTVNRFWEEVFGQGLVSTPEDFGVMGATPSHPELLDWLAVEFRDSGWDVKKLFQLMLTSATYRQSSATTTPKLERDPHNRFLSRGPRFRLDAEMVRDYALAASGLLTPTMYGPGVKPYQPEGVWDVVGMPEGDTRNYQQDHGENLYRRSLYTFWKRMAPPPNLEALNAPSREVCTVRRERTNTPLQALVTLNDPQFLEAARNLAQHALQSSGEDEQAAISYLAHQVLGRAFEEQERVIIRRNLQAFRDYYRDHVDDAQALVSVGESKPAEQVSVAELAAWTMVGNEILNLDEALNK